MNKIKKKKLKSHLYIRESLKGEETPFHLFSAKLVLATALR